MATQRYVRVPMALEPPPQRKLALENAHARDARIEFHEETHTYYVLDMATDTFLKSPRSARSTKPSI
jgi:hypothetical protein